MFLIFFCIKVYDADIEEDLNHEEGGYLGEMMIYILQFFNKV